MNRKLAAMALLIVSFVFTAGQAPRSTSTKSSNVTGQYRLRQDEFRNRLVVLQLPGGKIKFNLVALWVSHNNPENIHNGELQGIVSLDNGVAIYSSGNCKITMKFSSNKVRIMENYASDYCGFGANVIAAGSYRKIDSRKPKFDF